MEKHFKCATPFCGRSKSLRQVISQGRADFYPVTFANIPRILREGDFKSDVFMLTVAPPDKHGYCNLGVSVDYAWGALERPPLDCPHPNRLGDRCFETAGPPFRTDYRIIIVYLFSTSCYVVL